MRIYVGNLSFSATESELQDLFGQYGDVSDVALITDRETGRARGFDEWRSVWFRVAASDDDANRGLDTDGILSLGSDRGRPVVLRAPTAADRTARQLTRTM